MFIGEGPGFHENEQGLPFVGAAGRFLDELLQSIGLDRGQVFITNVVKCRPPGNRDPQAEELAACDPYLERQIQAINSKVIVTLGRFSMQKFLPNAKISHHRKYPYIQHEGYTTRIGAFPISIDFKHMFEFARSDKVAEAAWLFHEKFPKQKIMLGVDRLDYTKGIPHRIEAFERALKRYPEMRGQITLVQLVVPSRTEVPEYQALKKQIDEMVGRINGEFTFQGWAPIHYIFGTLSKEELFGVYRASEIALITPHKDGMNLVAKEYCTSCIEDKGVLILSEFAGAASELESGAILVNPYDVDEVAEAIFRAHYMEADEQRERIQRMRATIRKYDIFRWVDQFVGSFQFEEKNGEKPKQDTAEIPIEEPVEIADK